MGGVLANPGDTVLLEAGSYYGGYSLLAQTAPDNPVTVKPLERDTVYFKGPFTLLGGGLVLDGIRFRGEGQLIVGTDSDSIDAIAIRITNCNFDNLTAARWLQINEGARNVTVERNSFTNKNTKGQLLQMRPPYSGPMNHIIRGNYFADIAEGDGNGYETIQVGQDGVRHRYIETNVLIEQNLFEHADGESEAISIKTSNNVIRYNTFRESKGSLVFRHGHNNRAEGNIFLGEGVSSTGGIRFQGSNSVVINNYFEGVRGTGGRSPITVMDGTDPSCFEGGPSSECHCTHDDVACYSAVNGALVAFNSFVNSPAIRIGHNHSSGSNTIPPKDIVFTIETRVIS